MRASVGGGELQSITGANDALFAAIAMLEPQSVTYPSADGTPIQMWIVKPPGFDSGTAYPLVFWVHGGPQGAYLDSWSYRWISRGVDLLGQRRPRKLPD